MPPEFDPRWEYAGWEPDPAWTLLEGNDPACWVADPLVVEDIVFDPWEAETRRRGVPAGFRFGRGDPDAFDPTYSRSGRAAGRKRAADWADYHRPCKKCGDLFLPKDKAQAYCSRRCVPKWGWDAPLKYGRRPCVKCGKAFAPRLSGGGKGRGLTRTCDGCGPGVRRPTHEERGAGWAARFRSLWLGGARAADMERELGVSSTTLRVTRIRLGLPPRPPGNHPRKAAPPPAPSASPQEK